MLEGRTVNLRVAEKEDLPLVAEWLVNPDFFSYAPFPQRSKTEFEKQYDNLPSDSMWFLVEKKDSSRIGFIYHELQGNQMEIGYALIPSERNKGFGREAITIFVDYLFLSKAIHRIQAPTGTDNRHSQKVLEKSGFKKEGIIRKAGFVRGKWIDESLYSILREEWKEPRILTKTASKW